MKQFYKLKSLLRLSFLFIVLFSVLSVVNSCKKEGDGNDQFTDHLVQFEVKGTTGVVLKTIATQVGTNPSTIFNSPPTNPVNLPWTSGEMFVNSSQSQLNLSANATLPDVTSKLIVTIWVDNEVVASDTVKNLAGVQTAITFHSFLQ